MPARGVQELRVGVALRVLGSVPSDAVVAEVGGYLSVVSALIAVGAKL